MPACLFQQAAVKALETAKDLGHKTLEIKTDSKYTINGKDLICATCCFFPQGIFATVEWLSALAKETVSWLIGKPSCFFWPLGSSKFYTSLCTVFV